MVMLKNKIALTTVDTSVNIGGVLLKTPIMPASGTFSEDLFSVFDFNQLGACVLKTISEYKRHGNATPRICEVQNGLLNSIGIPSKGIDYFKEVTLPFYQQFETPLIVSVSAQSVDAFARACELVSIDGVSGIEVNISCPNIEANGRAFAAHADATYSVIDKIKTVTRLPIWAKLTPNTGDIVAVAVAAEQAGANALVVANTLLVMAIDVVTHKPKLAHIMGGLSGPTLKPLCLRMAYQCAKAVQIPIIGCGGISTLDDALEYFIAGASAVQVGTANFIDPNTMPQLIEQLPQYLMAHQMHSMQDLIGSIDESNLAEQYIDY